MSHLERVFMLRLSYLAMLVCAGVGIRWWRKIPGTARFFVVQAALAFCIEIIGYLTSSKPNLVYFNIYAPFEFAAILFAAKDFIGKPFFLYAIPASVIYVVMYVYDVAVSGIFYLTFHALAAGWLVLGCIYLVVLLSSLNRPSGPYTRSINIIAGMTLTYYFCTIPQYSLYRFLIESMPSIDNDYVSVSANAFSLMRYSVVAFGLWKMSQAVLPEQSASAQGEQTSFQKWAD